MYNPIRQPLMAFWAFALLAISMLWGASAYAVTPADTVISSRATVTYQDSFGNEFTAESNESTVVVAKVYNATLSPEDEQSKDGALGQTVYFPHQLTNNGNTEESFSLKVTAKSGSTFVAGSLKVYLDTNGNGQPDAGESEVIQYTDLNSTDGTKILVSAGATSALVVAAQVPQTASNSLSLVLTAKSEHSSFNNTATATSTDTINIVSDKPVLVVTKEVISHTRPVWNADRTAIEKGSITYSVKIVNNGVDLKAGAIYDFFPKYMDVDTLNVDKLSDARLDEHKIDTGLFPEAGQTYNSAKHHEKGLKIPFKSALTGGSNLRFELTVTYSAKAGDAFNFFEGDKLENTVYVGYGAKATEPPASKAASTIWDHVDKSNTTSEDLPSLFDVNVTDSVTEPAGPVYGGGIVEFAVPVFNTGNSKDSFNLSIQDDHTFPANTTFSFWIGELSLSNNNTGSIPIRGNVTVTVKAQLPENATLPTLPDGQTKGIARFVATSVGDAGQTDHVDLTLPTIGTSTVDLAYAKKDSGDGDSNPYNPADLPVEGEPGFAESAPGSTRKFDLFVHNQTGVAKSFSLKAYKSATGSFGNYTGSGQPELQVTFKKGDQTVTQTSTLTAEGLFSVEQLSVEVTVPAGQEAKDYSFAVIADGGENLKDAIGYTLRVTDSGDVSLTPDGTNQIAAGGSTIYNHRLINNSNKTRGFMVEGLNSAAGWSHVMTAGTASDADNTPVIKPSYVAVVLKPNEYLDFTVKVISPANAVPGSRDVLTLNVSEVTADSVVPGGVKPVVVENGLTAEATDTTLVVEGQVRLYKKVHVLDPQPASVPDAIAAAKSSDLVFGVTANKPALPEKDYVVWQVIATNEGDSTANTVTIKDAAPVFTTIVPGSAMVKNSDNTFTVVPDAISGSNVQFIITEPLNPGASVEVRFMVTVD